MTFRYPEFLWWLAALPAVPVVYAVSLYRARRTVGRFVGSGRRSEVFGALTIKHLIGGFLVTCAFASAILAPAGPQWGRTSVEDERRGLEIVYLIDVSNSMSARDIAPSRLVRAREVARAIGARLPGSYHSVVAFKGDASIVVPMTEDRVAFDLAMGNLSGALITAAGTSLESAVGTALSAFPHGSPRHRAVVMLSDGEALQGSIEQELDRIRSSEVAFFPIVTGTQQGATIPTRDGGVLRDETGDPVIVRVNETVMGELAEASGGRLFHISDPAVGRRIVEELEDAAGRGQDVVFRSRRVSRFHLFALGTVLCLFGATIVHNARWMRSV